jgi:hypothetical protein
MSQTHFCQLSSGILIGPISDARDKLSGTAQIINTILGLGCQDLYKARLQRKGKGSDGVDQRLPIRREIWHHLPPE